MPVALFGRKSSRQDPPSGGTRPVIGQAAFCGACGATRQFTQCWMRVGFVRQCPSCGMVFENPAELYERFQPACPRCDEFLEQPQFVYGLCDACGSKYELTPNAKPGLLPNKGQRDAMNKHGKVRIIE